MLMLAKWIRQTLDLAESLLWYLPTCHHAVLSVIDLLRIQRCSQPYIA